MSHPMNRSHGSTAGEIVKTKDPLKLIFATVGLEQHEHGSVDLDTRPCIIDTILQIAVLVGVERDAASEILVFKLR